MARDRFGGYVPEHFSVEYRPEPKMYMRDNKLIVTCDQSDYYKLEFIGMTYDAAGRQWTLDITGIDKEMRDKAVCSIIGLFKSGVLVYNEELEEMLFERKRAMNPGVPIMKPMHMILQDWKARTDRERQERMMAREQVRAN